MPTPLLGFPKRNSGCAFPGTYYKPNAALMDLHQNGNSPGIKNLSPTNKFLGVLSEVDVWAICSSCS